MLPYLRSRPEHHFTKGACHPVGQNSLNLGLFYIRWSRSSVHLSRKVWVLCRPGVVEIAVVVTKNKDSTPHKQERRSSLLQRSKADVVIELQTGCGDVLGAFISPPRLLCVSGFGRRATSTRLLSRSPAGRSHERREWKEVEHVRGRSWFENGDTVERLLDFLFR